MVTCSTVGAMEAWGRYLTACQISSGAKSVVGAFLLQDHQRIKKDQFCEIIKMVLKHIYIYIFFQDYDFGFYMQ